MQHRCHFSHTFPVVHSCLSTLPTSPRNPSPLPPAPAWVHPAVTSLPPEQKPIQARCFTPSWHVGQGRWSASGFSATTFPLSLSLPPFRPPSSDLFPPLHRHRRYFTAFPQLAWYRSGVARQLDRTAPENLCGVISHIM